MQSFSSLLKTRPYHLNLCRCFTVVISSIPEWSETWPVKKENTEMRINW